MRRRTSATIVMMEQTLVKRTVMCFAKKDDIPTDVLVI